MATVAIIEEAVWDSKAARAEIQIAWENHKRNGMAFGKVCYEWGQRVEKSKGGYASHGAGLSEILNVLSIPRHIFDYWSKAYEISIGGGIKCPHCDAKGFPSKGKLKKHMHVAHPSRVFVPEPVAKAALLDIELPPAGCGDKEAREFLRTAIGKLETTQGGDYRRVKALLDTDDMVDNFEELAAKDTPADPDIMKQIEEAGPNPRRQTPEVKAFWDELPKEVGGKLDSSNRGDGMAVDRLRSLASKLGIHARVQHEDHGFTLKIAHLSEKGAREILKFIGEDTEPTKGITYQCSACNGEYTVTADRIPPHYKDAAGHGTWHKPIAAPRIGGWSQMSAPQRWLAARATGCPYCLKYKSARSCPAHGWVEKGNAGLADIKRQAKLLKAGKVHIYAPDSDGHTCCGLNPNEVTMSGECDKPTVEPTCVACIRDYEARQRPDYRPGYGTAKKKRSKLERIKSEY